MSKRSFADMNEKARSTDQTVPSFDFAKVTTTPIVATLEDVFYGRSVDIPNLFNKRALALTPAMRQAQKFCFVGMPFELAIKLSPFELKEGSKLWTRVTVTLKQLMEDKLKVLSIDGRIYSIAYEKLTTPVSEDFSKSDYNPQFCAQIPQAGWPEEPFERHSEHVWANRKPLHVAVFIEFPKYISEHNRQEIKAIDF